MFESSNLPNPLGDSGNSGGDGALDQIVALVTPEIVPVRLVSSSPLPVQVTNWGNNPPPLSGLHGSGGPPPLPMSSPRLSRAKEGAGLDAIGLGDLAKLGTVAGAAAAGVGLVAAGLKTLKESAIDPIIGAAQGGLDRGIARGAGADVLGKAFEVAGVVIGVKLLPAVVDLASSALAAAKALKKVGEFDPWDTLVNAGSMGLGGKGSPLGETPAPSGGQVLDLLGNTIGNKRWWTDAIIPGMGLLPHQKLTGPTLGQQFDRDKVEERDKVLHALNESIGAKAQFVGVADIRAQAQMAAFQDPLEVEVKKELVEVLRKINASGAVDKVGQIADNTKAPPAGGHHA
jgi:hypothetical protein